LLDAPAKQDSPRSLRDAAILALLYATGLRAAEVVALSVDEVDLEKGWVGRPQHPDPQLPLGRALKPMRRYVVDGRPHLTRRPDERSLFLNQRGDRLSRQGLWLVVKRWTARLDWALTSRPTRCAIPSLIIFSKKVEAVARSSRCSG
jgi:integrase/recombinase XerD